MFAPGSGRGRPSPSFASGSQMPKRHPEAPGTPSTTEGPSREAKQMRAAVGVYFREKLASHLAAISASIAAFCLHLFLVATVELAKTERLTPPRSMLARDLEHAPRELAPPRRTSQSPPP